MATTPTRAAWAGLAFLYVIWGAGYPAAEVMLESIPPLLGMAARTLAAGTVLLAIALLRRRATHLGASPSELGWAVVVGMLLVFTNGLIVVGMGEVPAGTAALIVGSMPLWIVVLQSIGGRRASALDAIGVAIGFGGLALLVAPGGMEGGAPIASIALIVTATALQAGGTLTAQRVPLPADPLTTVAVGMIAAALCMSLLGFALGEASDLASGQLAPSAVLAWLFLAGPVALGGYLTFIWLLRRMPAMTVSTYAYVNPVIALLLAWALLGHAVTGATLLGAALILAAVAFVLARSARAGRPASRARQVARVTARGPRSAPGSC